MGHQARQFNDLVAPGSAGGAAAPGDGFPQVVVLGQQEGLPALALDCGALVDAPAQRGQRQQLAAEDAVLLPMRTQALTGVLAHRLQHPVAGRFAIVRHDQ